MANNVFELISPYKPTGDQPEAIKKLTDGVNDGIFAQTLLGATGTGKTFTIANVIKNVGKKTLVLAHNKTLAGQLYSELKAFFPNNHVEYFISYYDYYQPEAYVASKDLYIEKDASINDDIDEMRHSCVSSLLSYDDVIVVASVSCIYGIGDPTDYKDSMIILKSGEKIDQNELLEKLVRIEYTRNDYELTRGTFRVRGDTIDIMQTHNRDVYVRIELFDDEIDSIRIMDAINNMPIESKKIITITPATLFAVNNEKLKESIRRIKEELGERIEYFKNKGLLLEAERIKKKTTYDIEMMEEIGYCSGIENYSRHLSLREEGVRPYTLLDFFGDDYLMVIDESHVTLPQVHGMYNGDRARKLSLVDNGFRLPSALDNRPLTFDEFYGLIRQVIFVSATPGKFERENGEIIEQIIRPTGLLDPMCEVRPIKGQIDDLIKEIKARTLRNERTLVLTLTIQMSEDLTKYLKDLNIKVAYLHSEIKSLERLEVIRALRSGEYDVLVGINLLREGLDIPEVSLIAILDADKEGFLRSGTSLIQIIGRAARNSNGKVIMYADNLTDSINYAISETNRRRAIQDKYNKDNGITPKTIYKEISETLKITEKVTADVAISNGRIEEMSNIEKRKLIERLEKEMKEHAKKLNFEEAMTLRDLILEIKSSM